MAEKIIYSFIFDNYRQSIDSKIVNNFIDDY